MSGRTFRVTEDQLRKLLKRVHNSTCATIEHCGHTYEMHDETTEFMVEICVAEGILEVVGTTELEVVQ
jgi:hypothetical protein